MKIKKSELFNYYNSLEKFGRFKEMEFKYFRSRTKKILMAEIEPCQDAFKKLEDEKDLSDEKEYNKSRKLLVKGSAKIDQSGNSETASNGKTKIDPEKVDSLDAKLKKLDKEYKTLLDKIKANDEINNKFLEKEIDVEIKQLKKKDIPGDMTGDELDFIIDLIEH